MLNEKVNESNSHNFAQYMVSGRLTQSVRVEGMCNCTRRDKVSLSGEGSLTWFRLDLCNKCGAFEFKSHGASDSIADFCRRSMSEAHFFKIFGQFSRSGEHMTSCLLPFARSKRYEQMMKSSKRNVMMMADVVAEFDGKGGSHA